MNVQTADSADDEHVVVATDPSGRFERYQKCLGIGAYKKVYLAFDTDEGVEVAWNELRVDHLQKQDLQKVFSEVQILQTLRHDSIINLYHSWTQQGEVYFITELMTSGTLKSYIRKTNTAIKPKIVKNWCRQILKGLHYLHTRDQPIIHRDLKCDNIFINGNNGQAKIGDLGLAIAKNAQFVTSVLGTPEFMAPELYEEKYDEKVDIYSFGMVCMEIVTKQYPYQECSNVAQIYKKVTSGVKPQALEQIKDQETRDFIELCIQFDASDRPSAEQLLQHPFLQDVPPTNKQEIVSPVLSMDSPTHTFRTDSNITTEKPLRNSGVSNAGAAIISVEVVQNMLPVLFIRMTYIVPQQTKLSTTSSMSSTAQLPTDGSGSLVYNKQEVKFPFDVNSDTCQSVVLEMVREGVLDAFDQIAAIAKMQQAVDNAKNEESTDDVQIQLLRKRSSSLGYLDRSLRRQSTTTRTRSRSSPHSRLAIVRSSSARRSADSTGSTETVRTPDIADARRHSFLSVQSTAVKTPSSAYHKSVEEKTNEIIQGAYISKYRRAATQPNFLLNREGQEVKRDSNLTDEAKEKLLALQTAAIQQFNQDSSKSHSRSQSVAIGSTAQMLAQLEVRSASPPENETASVPNSPRP